MAFVISGCPSGSYGVGCLSRCLCANAANCDHVSGACLCAPGWIGIVCDKPCPDGYYGQDCQLKCACENNGRCSPVTGRCLVDCLPGDLSKDCNHTCPAGSWGNSCEKVSAIDIDSFLYE